jgi:PTS system mannose-specific IIA component
MVGLVIATHGHLADELVATAEQIVGKLAAVATCSIDAAASPAEIQRRVDAAISSVDTGEGVVVLADLFGGTPCNQSLLLIRRHQLEVIAGVNLPMLLKANSLRSEIHSLPELASALAAYGQKNITCASAMLREASAGRNH